MHGLYYLGGDGCSNRVLDKVPLLRTDARMLRRWVEHQQEPRHAPDNSDHAGHIEYRLPAERGDEESAHQHSYRGAKRRGCKFNDASLRRGDWRNRASPSRDHKTASSITLHAFRSFLRLKKRGRETIMTISIGLDFAIAHGKLDHDHLPIMWETNLLRSIGGIHRAVIGWMAGQVAPWFARRINFERLSIMIAWSFAVAWNSFRWA